jgi:hypothetical protein
MTVPAQPFLPNPTNTPLFDVPLGGTLESIVQSQASPRRDDELAAVTQTMALEGQAVELSAASRADHIEDLLRAPGRLLWRTDQ